MSEPTPRLGWPHLMMFVPGIGAAVVALMASGRDSHDKAELLQAAKWQGGAFLILLVHLGLQLAIWLVQWMFASMPPEYLDTSPLSRHVPTLLWLCTHGNLTACAAEWGMLAWFAIKASRGQAYPDRSKKNA
jgi:hypothetical protein